MFGNNHLPTNMRFRPPPPFFPVPPMANQTFPPGWAPPPSFVHQPPPPWNNPYNHPRMLMQEGSRVQVNRHHVPAAMPELQYIPQNSTAPRKSQEEIDIEWIKGFLQRCSAETPTHMKDHDAKLSKAKQLHLKAYKLLKMLQENCQSESGANSTIVSATKKELDEILRLFNDDEYVTKIAASALRRKRKRARSKIRKQENFERKRELGKLIKEKHVIVDKWLEDRRKAEDDLKRERKVRKDLDEYLSDVRQKQQSAQKHLNLFNAMAKLRKARCEAIVQKGQSPPSQTHNEVFKAAQNSACKRLRDFITECKKEENFMRKYLTEEHEAEERRIQQEMKKEKERMVQDWKSERSQVLFGPEDDSDPSDPMRPVREIQCQGTKSLMGLVNVRSQWDQFISDTGSRIPTRWVEPALPSSDKWQNYLSTS